MSIPLGEAILDILMTASLDETASALAYVVRHHAIHAELTGGDDCCVCWLAAIRQAVDAAECQLGTYIERERALTADDAVREAILTRARERAAA